MGNFSLFSEINISRNNSPKDYLKIFFLSKESFKYLFHLIYIPSSHLGKIDKRGLSLTRGLIYSVPRDIRGILLTVDYVYIPLNLLFPRLSGERMQLHYT